jgi:hypothetical protein
MVLKIFLLVLVAIKMFHPMKGGRGRRNCYSRRITNSVVAAVNRKRFNWGRGGRGCLVFLVLYNPETLYR